MDVKKLVSMSLSCTNFGDAELNRIMQDKTARNAFVDIADCYKEEETPKRLECIMNRVVTKLCGKENQELFQCLQEKPGGDVKKCYTQLVMSQKCANQELHNLLLVAKGIN